MNAREYLEQDIKVWADLRAMHKGQPGIPTGPTFREWLLENGQEFGPAIRIKGHPLQKIKECYSNSLRAVMYHEVDPKEWFYTEGVVLGDGLPILIDHAWLSNKNGDVLDLTMRKQKDATYYGVPFKPDWAIARVIKQGYFGLFMNGGAMYDRDIFNGKMAKGRAWKKERELVA